MKNRNYSRLTLLALCVSLAPAAMAQVSRTPWQMNQGEGVIKNLKVDRAKLSEVFDRATIPAEGAGWAPAPNTDTIGFGSDSASQIDEAGGTCDTALDFTYFQTFVNVPSGTTVDEFKIIFSGMDDASRITVFNTNHPTGLVVEGSYVTKVAGIGGTSDLKDLMAAGSNRVVITQVDWCPSGNKLQSAKVELNGSMVAATPSLQHRRRTTPLRPRFSSTRISAAIARELVEGMNVGPLALGNDVTSSVKVANCWRVVLYGAGPGQKGPELVLTADNADLSANDFDEIVSNVHVERDPKCGDAPATLFEHKNFEGRSQALLTGMNVGPLALGNDVTSSVRVAKCWKVTLYGAAQGQNGPERVLTADDADLSVNDFDEIVSNVLVESDPSCQR
ncbi:MAG: hypothetical protein IPK97_14115 [Ahniella sp.]|nr:hypothetical protein [Ahniella sp.]